MRVAAYRQRVAGSTLPGLPPVPNKKLAVVACMDARLDVEELLGLERGDAHIIRNAGALVTEDVQRSLATSRKLGTEETALILHTDCGARQGEDLDASVREAAAQLEAPVTMYVYDVESRELREVR
jgi:carbonic anhydrase